MSYWAREIAGWVLILLGLYVFYQAYDMLLRKRVIEAIPLTFAGFVVFRGGIHLLKVAVAAQAARGLQLAAITSPTKRARAETRSVGPTPSKNVLPGPQNRPRPRDDEPAAGRRRE